MNMYRMLLIIPVSIVFMLSSSRTIDGAPPHTSQQTDIETQLTRAYELLKNNQLADAAMIFFSIRQNPLTPTQFSNTALNQFSHTINRLRTDRNQTDIFAQRIRTIPNNEHQKILMTHYASMLEAQNRTTEMTEVYRQIYRRWPGTQEKYTLAQKLQKAEYYQESYELFSEMLEYTQFRSPVLRQMLEIVRFLDDSNTLFIHLLNKYNSDIEFKYDLLSAALTTAIDIKDYTRAKDIAVKLLRRYPYSTDIVLQRLIPLVQNGTLVSHDITAFKKLFAANMSDDQRYALARLYAASGSIETAIQILGPVSQQKALEYKADLLYTSGNLEHAQQLYSSLANTYGTSSIWYQKLADICFKQGNDEMAKTYLYKFLENSRTKDFNTYFYVGKMFERYGFTDDAKQIYLLGKRSVHDKASASQEIIKFYLSQNDFVSAVQEIVYTQVNGIISPYNLYYALSDLFYDHTTFDRLITTIDNHVTTQSLTELQQSALYYCLYIFCLESTDTEQAISYFKHYFSLNPAQEAKVITFSTRLEQEQHLQQAYDILSLVSPASSHYSTVIRRQAALLCALGAPSSALELLHQHPRFSDPILWASTYLNAGDFANAAIHINRCKQFTPQYFRIKGDIALANAQFQQARTDYQRIAANTPDIYLEASLNAALTYLFDNQPETAAGIFEQLGATYPTASAANDALYFRKMIALFGGNAETLNQWAQAEYLFWKKDFSASAEKFTALIDAHPYEIFVPAVRLRLFSAYTHLHQHETAIMQISTLTTQFPDTPLIPYLMRLSLEYPFSASDKITAYQKILYSYPNTFDADIIRNLLQTIESNTLQEQTK